MLINPLFQKFVLKTAQAIERFWCCNLTHNFVHSLFKSAVVLMAQVGAEVELTELLLEIYNIAYCFSL